MKNTLSMSLAALALATSTYCGAITYTYDDLSRLTSVTYDDGGKIAYAYDATGNISSITKTPPGAGSTTTTSASTTTTSTATTTTTSTATTTTGAATTTTTGSTTTTTMAGSGVTRNFAQGWNLAGNGNGQTISVPLTFGDANQVTTVWKWIASTSKWAFYTPALIGHSLIDYAASKGYDVLVEVGPGEGFWVNAKSEFSVQVPSGTAVSSASFQNMGQGWNLIAVGDNPTPSAFNKALSATPPAEGEIPSNVVTLWAWDSSLSNWYFYAPSLDKSGGLGAYVASKGYLDFGANNKTLSPGVGFWVNKP